MHETYSADQVVLLRQATELAAEIAGTTTDDDRGLLANYVLSAYEAGIRDKKALAYRATRQFSLWNFSIDPPSAPPESTARRE